ncbi:ankyrin repeat-containing domain protein [Leptodontidium sp. MPI-SDFR-AT-0119]|nr:ankyrin repeat-containing domain protein [Leptodontidium sp. MPI-SDFR-AT-0119]
MLHLLFEMAAYALATEKPSKTWLLEAAVNGYGTVFGAMLVRTGVVTAEEKSAALLFATGYGHQEIVRTILESRIDVDSTTGALHVAAVNGYDAIVRLLLEAGAGVEGPTLAAVASSGHYHITELLIDSGADIVNRDVLDDALLKTASNSHSAVVQLLLQRGAKVNIRDHFTDITNRNKLHKALQEAVRNGGETAVLLLLELGAGVDREYRDDILMSAVCRWDAGILKVLLDWEVDFTNQESSTIALINAVQYGVVDSVRLLLDNGADVNTEFYNGGNPISVLGWALNKMDKAILDLLIHRGAKVKAEDQKRLDDINVNNEWGGWGGRPKNVNELTAKERWISRYPRY